ncbi:hypothetical protein [Spirosoma validum]|uniref:Uncharacterized protein n=1 Tax=Spirosoma validum TaxID=2771355 RepID=A0A927GBU3_9BACT|nr:hypothetical protein [Spirosoma validum]MBD2752077.1 hypothetical protein [Spirosoma validum]
MNPEELSKWERQRTQGQVRFVTSYTLKLAAICLLISILFGPLWPILKSADLYTVLANTAPISWWMKKVIFSLTMGLGTGLYQWQRAEKEYKKYLDPGTDN